VGAAAKLVRGLPVNARGGDDRPYVIAAPIDIVDFNAYVR
jgi:hypothetical protein